MKGSVVSGFFVILAVSALVTPAVGAERLTPSSPDVVKQAYLTAVRSTPALSSGFAEVVPGPARREVLPLGALPNQEAELTTIIIGPPVSGVPCFNCVSGISGSVGSTQSQVRFNRNVTTEMNFFYQIGNYTGPATNAWAIVRLNPNVTINGNTFNFTVSSANVIGAIEWTNVVIPAAATAGDALLFVTLKGGSSNDTWYQFIKLN